MAAPPAPRRPHLAVLVTSPDTARFLARGQLAFLRRQGLDVTLISAPHDDLARVAEREGVAVAGLPMRREISPFHDLVSLARLLRLLRRIRPDVLNASTPKAAVLGMVAGKLAGVPYRIYTNRGLRLETSRGGTRLLLRCAERLANTCAHQVVSVSPSLRRLLVDLRLAPASKTLVVGPGSSNGVDCERFKPDGPAGESSTLRSTLGLEPEARVVGFVGRFTRDKGLIDLLAAFETIAAELPAARLLVVGRFEAGDPVPAAVRQQLESDPRIVVLPFVDDTAPYYRLMDVLVLPSYREGFPNAPLEAAASAVPVVGYAATGLVDAVVDGETGTLVPTGQIEALAAAVLLYLREPALALAHGRSGRQRALTRFRRELVWQAWIDHYRTLPIWGQPS